ncbi:sodium/hydrogen exchanger [Plasmodium brasilianum]|uniref:Sodium/hydrogen exchanger n=1 Tax=Plasmodium brasilianum TaxID=5824 RepID=A0ACB9Y0H2_PLABR|nr:sodium/hydrogen exchanger [Plasmodium brasilianum]
MLYTKLFNYKKRAKKKNLGIFCDIIIIKVFVLFLFLLLMKNEERDIYEKSVTIFSKPGQFLFDVFFELNDVDQIIMIREIDKKEGKLIKCINEECRHSIFTHYSNYYFNVIKGGSYDVWNINSVNKKWLELTHNNTNKNEIAFQKRIQSFRILSEEKKTVKKRKKRDIVKEEDIYELKDDDEHKNQLPTASNEVSEGIIFFCFIFISATMLQFILSKIHQLNIPVSVIWFLYGMCTYLIAKNLNVVEENTLHKSIINARNIDSSVLYFILLPILLYEATQDINYYAFKNFLYGGIGLAVVGVALQVGILGILFYYSFMYRQEQSPLSSSFLLASILSSTDPVAVLSILNVVEAPSKISSMFHVESLINDGSSVLLFQFFFYLTIGYKANASQYVILFVKLLFLSPVFGIGMAMLTFAWINLYKKYYYNQCLATITMCYLCYFVSEYYFNLSGPLAIVCYGLFINAYGHIALDEIAQRKHKEIVELLSLMGNSSIFIISGIVSFGMMENVFKDNLYFFFYIVLTYIYLVFARTVMILIFTPFMARIGYPVNWKEILLLIWGGLRGGIVLVLGLRIEAENKINDKLTKELAYYISGSVLLILTIQGLTFECLYKILNVYPPNPFRIVYLEKVLKMIDYNFSIRKNNLKNYWLFKGTNILHFSNKIVPELYWRKMNKYGEFDLRLPDIYACLQDISSCNISLWEQEYDSQTIIESFDDISSNGKESFYNRNGNRIPGKEKKENVDKETEDVWKLNNGMSSIITLKEVHNNKIFSNYESTDRNKDNDSAIDKKKKGKINNFTDIEFEDNSDEYSYIHNEYINNNNKKKKKKSKTRNGNNKYRVGEFITRGRINYNNSFKGEMKIRVIRNNDNYLSSYDEDEHNNTNVNYSLSSKNYDRLSNNLNELSENDSSYSEKVCDNSKIKNLNAFNYDKISIRNYDRLINKMNYREFKRTKTEKENFTVIDNIVNNNDIKETFNPKYNLRLIEHATDFPKTLSDNMLVRSNVDNENENYEDNRSNVADASDKSKKKKKNFLNFLSEHNAFEEKGKGRKEESNTEEEYPIKSIKYDKITKEEENLLNDYQNLKKIGEDNNEGASRVANLEKEDNELIMNDNFIIKIQKEKSPENEKGEKEEGEGEQDKRKYNEKEKDEVGNEDIQERCNSCGANGEMISVDDGMNNEDINNENNQEDYDEYLTYKNLFALDSNVKRISSFFNSNYNKNNYLKNTVKNSSELNISTKGTNSKSLALMNNEIEKRKKMKNNIKYKCKICMGGLPFCNSSLRKNSYSNLLRTMGSRNEKNYDDNKNSMSNYKYAISNVGNNIDVCDGTNEMQKLQRNNTTDLIAQRYDTDQTINFECVEGVYPKKNVPAFYSFLKRPKMKIKNKLFGEIRKARSHESYENKKVKSGKSKDDVFYSSLRKKIVRKEREGELYIMIFNTCRELYKKLYVNGFISGECLLTLTSILDLSADFALKKVRMNPIKAWADAFDKSKNKNNNKKSIDHRNGFEYEFNVLLSKLKINKKHSFFFSPKVVNIFLVYEHCMKDLQIILSYVDVHQCTLDKGGITMKLLLGKNLLKSYYRNIELAKSLIPQLVNKYKDVIKYCLIKIGADMLMHLKKTIVNEQAANGLLLTQDNEKLNGIFDDQQIKINRYRPYLHYILKRNMLRMLIKK